MKNILLVPTFLFGIVACKHTEVEPQVKASVTLLTASQEPVKHPMTACALINEWNVFRKDGKSIGCWCILGPARIATPSGGTDTIIFFRLSDDKMCEKQTESEEEKL